MRYLRFNFALLIWTRFLGESKYVIFCHELISHLATFKLLLETICCGLEGSRSARAASNNVDKLVSPTHMIKEEFQDAIKGSCDGSDSPPDPFTGAMLRKISRQTFLFLEVYFLQT